MSSGRNYLEAHQIVTALGREEIARQYRDQWGEDAAADDQLASHMVAITPFTKLDGVREGVLDALAGRPPTWPRRT